jgi:hypothetical protein
MYAAKRYTITPQTEIDALTNQLAELEETVERLKQKAIEYGLFVGIRSPHPFGYRSSVDLTRIELVPLDPLLATIPVAEFIENQLDPGRHSQFFEDPTEVVPYRMFLNFKPFSDFAVLQAVGDEMNHFFFAAR